MGNNFDLGPVTDKSGAEVSADDVISRAIAPHKVEFEYDGLNYAVFIRKSQVPGRLSNRVQAITSKLAIRAGFKPGEDISEEDERFSRFMELVMENDVLDAAYADVAVAATIVEDGKPVTNVPQLLNLKKFDRDALLSLGGLGDAYATAVRTALNPTSTEDGAAAAPKTRKAKATKS